MSNIVLATKWRPKLFSDLIGQDPVVTALINSLDNQRLHHSYLFTGTRGVGKTTLARILAKCLNCETNGVSSKPCGKCASCLAIDAGQFVDLYEVDAASRTKVEDTRELLENVQYLPTQGRFKIYLIDEVHMLSTHSFNALLKTLEEPPEHVKFILATTDPQKIPSTILSRCLHFSLNRISAEVIRNQLEKVLTNENINFEENATKNISKIADGSMRDALSISEQCISHGDNKITYNNICKILCLMPAENINEIVNLIVNNDVKKLMDLIEQMYFQTADFKYILEELISIFHQTAMFKVTNKLNDSIYDTSIKSMSEKYSEEEIQVLYQTGVANLKDIEFAPDHKSGFEIALIRMILFMPFKIDTSEENNNNGNLEKISSKKKPSDQDLNQKSLQKKNNSKEKEVLSIENNWEIIVKRLDIDSITRNLAKNIIFDKKIDNTLHFLIGEDRASVVTEKSKDKLKEALTNYFGNDIKIFIETSNNDLSTLHKKDEEDYNNKISNADKIINNDDFIKTIKEKFDATSVENSVQIKDLTNGE